MELVLNGTSKTKVSRSAGGVSVVVYSGCL